MTPKRMLASCTFGEEAFELFSWRQISVLRQHAAKRGWRRAIATLTLVFFAFQSYLVQTHVHLLLQGKPAASVEPAGTGFAAKKAEERGALPPADNPATCPICMDMVTAGHFAPPAAIVLPLPPSTATYVALAIAAQNCVAAISHIWFGRAPPR